MTFFKDGLSRFQLTERTLLLFCLLLALTHGLIYVFLMPPWQHYDEPNHFEFAWLIANRPEFPKTGDFDSDMSRAVVKSMKKNNFYDGMIRPPNLKNAKEPVRIGGFPQLDVPPLYYIVVSLPLRLMQSSSVTEQLYIGRFISLLFFLGTILAAWGILREITPPKNALRWIVPVSLALLPGFADVMTAFNSDALAVVICSLSLWGDIRLVRRGLSLPSLLLALLPALLSPFTKSTALFTLPLVVVAVLISLLKGRTGRRVWITAAVVMVAAPFFLLAHDDAAVWYRATSQAEATRVSSPLAPVGEHALLVHLAAPTTPKWISALFQPLLPEIPPTLQGKDVTLGVWMWADSPVEIVMPTLWNDYSAYTTSVQVGTEPKFFAYSRPIGKHASRIWVNLDYHTYNSKNVRLFLDGMVLAEGKRSGEEAPVFEQEDGSRGTWDGRPFENLLRNGSAEASGLRVAPWADTLGAKILPDNNRPSFLLTSLLDLSATWPMFRTTAEHLLRTFWGLFGWAHVFLLGSHPYRVLGAITLIGVLGATILLIRRLIQRKSLPWAELLVAGLAVLILWGGTFTRGVTYLSMSHLYLPVARYTYPVIIPTLLILCAGWRELFDLAGKALKIATPWRYSLFWVFWLGLDAYSILSILAYYGK